MTSSFLKLFSATALGLALVACNASEPTEAEMKSAVEAENPRGQDLKKISCAANKDLEGHTCAFKLTIENVAYDAKGRFYREGGNLKVDARNTVIHKAN